uniref:Uncharacterized protein n=1 Tax=Panagrolaimus davidi TaxID=227884 RepID=A0A914P2U1_9BILA
MGITETSDYGIVVQIVTSTTKKKYFVIAELKRACVTFVQNDDTKYEYDYLNVGKTVLVERNAANEVENLRISEVSDKYDNELVNNDGFIAKCIFRYDVNGKKEHDYFVGGLRIHNIECDFDDVESSEESDSSSDDDDDSSDGAVEANDDEEENGTLNLEVLNPIFTLPNIFYGRIIVPKVLIDCRHRNDAFYARENVPFIWLPSRYVAI